MTSPRDLVRPDVLTMTAYAEEPGGGLDLMANTNLFGVNPALARALAVVRADRLTEYPSLTSQPLRQAIGEKLGLQPSQVVTGNGSNDLIDVILRTFVSPGDPVAWHLPTFSMIPAFARLNHATCLGVPLDEAWALDPERLVRTRAKVTFVVRPNNPTGNAFPRRDVERVIEASEGIVVVDEAYVEFLGGESFVKEVREGNDRVIVLRTFSKAHGMAGLRVGYALAPEPLATELQKVRGPFRLDALAETAACLAASDDRFVQATVEGVRSERPHLKTMLETRGFEVFRSDANFLLVRPPVPSRALATALAERGIFVRDFGGDLAPFLRITVGPPPVTARLKLVLDDVLPSLRKEATA